MLDLTREDLIVLFELCHRICETSKVAASHRAEVVLIDKIAGQLERSLAEPFRADYANLLDSARMSILKEYRARMGENVWIDGVALDQV